LPPGPSSVEIRLQHNLTHQSAKRPILHRDLVVTRSQTPSLAPIFVVLNADAYPGAYGRGATSMDGSTDRLRHGREGHWRRRDQGVSPRRRLPWIILTVEHRLMDECGTLAAARSCRWWNPSGGYNLGGGGNWRRRK
jgi:hypothetical protein